MAEGVQVGIATGRSLASARACLGALEPNGLMIVFNGSRAWSPAEKRYLLERSVGKAVALTALLQIAADPEIHVNLYTGDEILIAARNPKSIASERKDGVTHREVGPLDAWLRREGVDPVKLLFISDPDRLDRLRKKLTVTAEQGTLIRSEIEYLELTGPHVTKGSALDELVRQGRCRREEVVVFGDNLNDLELFAAAGLSVAMANALPAVLKVAGRTIGRHDGPAIPDFLRELFPEILSPRAK